MEHADLLAHAFTFHVFTLQYPKHLLVLSLTFNKFFPNFTHILLQELQLFPDVGIAEIAIIKFPLHSVVFSLYFFQPIC